MVLVALIDIRIIFWLYFVVDYSTVDVWKNVSIRKFFDVKESLSDDEYYNN